MLSATREVFHLLLLATLSLFLKLRNKLKEVKSLAQSTQKVAKHELQHKSASV